VHASLRTYVCIIGEQFVFTGMSSSGEHAVRGDFPSKSKTNY